MERGQALTRGEPSARLTGFKRRDDSRCLTIDVSRRQMLQLALARHADCAYPSANSILNIFPTHQQEAASAAPDRVIGHQRQNAQPAMSHRTLRVKSSAERLRILVIRNDNIGDMVCTLPLIQGLRNLHPKARISILANTYNRAVLEGHPSVDEVITYTKQAHRRSVTATVLGAIQKASMIARLAARRFDLAIAAATPVSPRTRNLLRWIAPKRAVFAVDPTQGHEAERVWSLGRALGFEGPPPAARIQPDPNLTRRIRKVLDEHFRGRHLAIHISSRKPSQQWPTTHFVELIRDLAAQKPEWDFVLLWSPGEDTGGAHPGDDQKAREIVSATAGLRVHPVATPHLPDTIATLAACDAFIGSDGGAMHLAAAVGLPIVCLFGGSSVAQWHPWKTPHIALQAATHHVGDITPATVSRAFGELMSSDDAERAA